MNKYILAIDSFKGCLSSIEAEAAASKGIRMSDEGAEIICIPVSDGGEGMLEAFMAALKAERVEAPVHDPLMRPIIAEYGIKDRLAIIEVAKACGLTLLSEEERNPLRATSYGVGELILDAINHGCNEFIIGLGGTAISDCGIGMLQAIIECEKKQNWDEVSYLFANLKIILASDVSNPLYGENGAAYVFARQKGADDRQIELLERKAKTFADISRKHFGYDFSHTKGAGAAGGLGYAFIQYMHATMKSGIELLLDLLNFDRMMEGTTCVITGEGRADSQTLMGKLPFGIMEKARSHKISTCLIAGQIINSNRLRAAGFADILNINPLNFPVEDAMKSENAIKNITDTIKQYIKGKWNQSR